MNARKPIFTANQESVLTYWWFDNFNQNVDSHTRKGAIDSNHIVEFSERNDLNLASSAAANVTRSKHRSLAQSGIDLPSVKVDKKGAQCYFIRCCQKTGSNKWTRKPGILMNYINFGCSESSIIKRSACTHIFEMVCCYTNWSVG